MYVHVVKVTKNARFTKTRSTRYQDAILDAKRLTTIPSRNPRWQAVTQDLKPKSQDAMQGVQDVKI